MSQEPEFEPSPRLRRTIAITIALAGVAQPLATIVIQIVRMVREIVTIWSQTG